MTKIEGRVAFPSKHAHWDPEPHDGDVWEAEIEGENPRKTVYFLRPVRLLSTRAEREREEREREKRKAREWIEKVRVMEREWKKQWEQEAETKRARALENAPAWLAGSNPTAREMLRRARARYSIETTPDAVERFSDIHGDWGLLAIHFLPTTLEDAWGMKVDRDVIRVKFTDDVEGVRKRTFVFFHLEPEQVEEYKVVCQVLEDGGFVDVDDYRNTPRLMAYYPLSFEGGE